MAFCLKGNAQTWVTIPDANFATYLQGLIPAAMNGNQMNIDDPLVTTTTHSINVSSSGGVPYFSNLSGIQYFTSLTYLNCNSNALISLPTLPDSLTYLDCGYNVDLTSLPALPSKLTYLSCFDSKLTSLPVLPNTLTYLDCSGNYMTGGYLTSLPALPNTLTYLNCSGNNNLTHLPTLPNSLQTLRCDEDNITCFPVFPNSITTFSIDPNPYDCLPNYISAMNTTDLAIALCASGNTHGCAVVTSGISKVSNSNPTISIYPNPSNGYLNIESQNEIGLVSVYNNLGQLVYSQTTKNSKLQIDLSQQAAGIYLVKLQNQFIKIIKQ